MIIAVGHLRMHSDNLLSSVPVKHPKFSPHLVLLPYAVKNAGGNDYKNFVEVGLNVCRQHDFLWPR